MVTLLKILKLAKAGVEATGELAQTSGATAVKAVEGAAGKVAVEAAGKAAAGNAAGNAAKAVAESALPEGAAKEIQAAAGNSKITPLAKDTVEIAGATAVKEETAAADKKGLKKVVGKMREKSPTVDAVAGSVEAIKKDGFTGAMPAVKENFYDLIGVNDVRTAMVESGTAAAVAEGFKAAGKNILTLAGAALGFIIPIPGAQPLAIMGMEQLGLLILGKGAAKKAAEKAAAEAVGKIVEKNGAKALEGKAAEIVSEGANAVKKTAPKTPKKTNKVKK